MGFWIIITVLALIIVALFTLAAQRGGRGETDSAAFDLQVYRDQLREVDRDLARGVLSDDEAARVRVEVSRRILAADAQATAAAASKTQPRGTPVVIGVAALLTVLGGSLLLYQRLGVPGYQDLPIGMRLAASEDLRANRMTQTEAQARLPEGFLPKPDIPEAHLALVEKLRDVIAQRPDDIEGLNLLARSEAALGNFEAAIEARQRLIALQADKADAADHTYLAELMMDAAGGYVSQEAEAALRAALEIDPRYPFARYYLAQYLMQVDRPDAAFRTLEALLLESGPDAPWVIPIREQIEEIAWRAGVNYQLPPLGNELGPDAAAVTAAQDMSAEERDAMIRGMVARLSERLASEGGPVDEWARLIRALGVLDDKDQADAIWREAKQVFATDPNALRLLYLAAQDAEIAQ